MERLNIDWCDHIKVCYIYMYVDLNCKVIAADVWYMYMECTCIYMEFMFLAH